MGPFTVYDASNIGAGGTTPASSAGADGAGELGRGRGDGDHGRRVMGWLGARMSEADGSGRPAITGVRRYEWIRGVERGK